MKSLREILFLKDATPETTFSRETQTVRKLRGELHYRAITRGEENKIKNVTYVSCVILSQKSIKRCRFEVSTSPRSLQSFDCLMSSLVLPEFRRASDVTPARLGLFFQREPTRQNLLEHFLSKR